MAEDKISPSLLREMLRLSDEKHEEAHHRMRLDMRVLDTDVQGLKAEVVSLKLALERHAAGLTAVQTAPIDVGKIVFNPKMVLAIVALVASIVTGNYVTTTQAVSVLRVEFTQVKESVDDLKRQMEMRRLEIQNLTNNLQQLQRSSK